MEAISIKNLIFKYPLGEKNALDNINLDINTSEFIVICGKSGCGKSTLLKHLKKNLQPYGKREGEVLYYGEEIAELEDRRSAAEIGFVQQNPDNQIVTDKVWHELAFGLESLGLDNYSIKRRVAEMASYFDIQSWFRKDVNQLSGGQKQLLNLASIMAMQPKVLILDEPTSQLDPIAASEFLQTIYKINRDLGTTIVISEHRLEELIPMADRVMVMDKAKIIAFDTPRKIGKLLAGNKSEESLKECAEGKSVEKLVDKSVGKSVGKSVEKLVEKSVDKLIDMGADESLPMSQKGLLAKDGRHPMFYGMPSVMRIFNDLPKMRMDKEETPLTIREARLWIEKNVKEPKVSRSLALEKDKSKEDKIKTKTKTKTNNPLAIDIKNLWFRYDKNSGDVLRGLNLQVEKGEWYCLLGGNGAGKSTTLKAITKIIKSQRGTIKIDGKFAMVPQNPQSLFTEITVGEELLEALYYIKISDKEKMLKVTETLKTMEIEHLINANPYDLSGGEQQRLALGKILLLEPEILLLDEPTKGLDPFFKKTLAGVLRALVDKGVTIFMVSHDIEFCAEYSDKCAMFFDGDLASVGQPAEFFSGNNFYTTTANKIARDWVPSAITCQEVVSWLGTTI